MWDLAVSVPDHCLSFLLFNEISIGNRNRNGSRARNNSLNFVIMQ